MFSLCAISTLSTMLRPTNAHFAARGRGDVDHLLNAMHRTAKHETKTFFGAARKSSSMRDTTARSDGV